MLKKDCFIGLECYYGTQLVTILTKPQPNYTVGVGYLYEGEIITLVVFMDSLTKTPNYNIL